MKTLLIIAHGSRRETSNQEVRALAERVRGVPTLGFDRVATGFLELAEPSVPSALEQCIAKGASEIAVFPYFLAAGRHVVTDIPAAVAPVRERYPWVQIELLPHLGAATGMAELISATADDSTGTDREDQVEMDGKTSDAQ